MIGTFYQPIVRLSDRQPLALEALARLNHPTRGTILPEQFVPDIEQAGLASRLSEIVAAIAFQDLASPALAAFRLQVTLNFPPHVLTFDAALDRLDDQCHAAGIRADQVMIELTEGRPVDSRSGGATLRRRRPPPPLWPPPSSPACRRGPGPGCRHRRCRPRCPRHRGAALASGQRDQVGQRSGDRAGVVIGVARIPGAHGRGRPFARALDHRRRGRGRGHLAPAPRARRGLRPGIPDLPPDGLRCGTTLAGELEPPGRLQVMGRPGSSTSTSRRKRASQLPRYAVSLRRT